MKYKLINSQTKEEHLCEKVTIGEFDYYVSDENIGNEYYYHINLKQILHRNNSHIDYLASKKVIATNNPNIDIPKVVDKAERLAWNYTTEKYPDINDEDSSQEELNIWNSYWEGFQAGYNKSKETHPFSEEDVIEFLDWKEQQGYVFTSDGFAKIGDSKFYTSKEILQLWKEQRPKVVYYE